MVPPLPGPSELGSLGNASSATPSTSAPQQENFDALLLSHVSASLITGEGSVNWDTTGTQLGHNTPITPIQDYGTGRGVSKKGDGEKIRS